jgi:Protein distantly related to bacterial ferritins
MGKKAREIIEGISIEEVINDLNSVYADEWISHFQYWVFAHAMKGVDADTFKKELLKQSMDELGHAEKIARRIIQLGFTPPSNLEDIVKYSGCGELKIPENLTDYEGFIEEILRAERCAITKYNELLKKYRYKDHLTYELAEELLEDEVDDEETWESFLEQYRRRKK